MDGADHVIEGFEHAGLVFIIEPPVRQNIRFDALEQPQLAAMLGVPGVDLFVLLLDLFSTQPACVAGILGMIGYAQVPPFPVACRLRHLRDRGAAIAVYGMTMKAAAQVFQLDEFGQLMRRRDFYFFTALA